MSGADKENGAPSKSQRKRESTALQKMGERLITMPESQFLKIAMPDALRDAVRDARKMKSRRALYRQRQFIGKLMREIDSSAIAAALAEQDLEASGAAKRFHQLERWRDRLIEQGDALLGELVHAYPAVDRQHVRQLIRQAQLERAGDKPPASARSLFRYLKSLTPADTVDASGADDEK